MGREVSQELKLMSDQQLVEDVRAGDRSSYSELVKRHQKGLLRLSMRFVKDVDSAQDIVQEAFIKAYEKLNTFEGRSTFKSWLFQIAVNTARNKLRASKRIHTDIEDMDIGVAATAENNLVHMAVGELLQKEVEKLPFKQKTALVLRVYEDMSFSEIADVMDCPYDTAKANYRHALLKLKDIFKNRSEFSSLMNDSAILFTQVNTQFAEAE